MNSSDQNAKLPTWLFIVTDIALIGVATLIALLADGKPSTGQMTAIVACVGLGAIIGLVPLVAGYERQKNEALDERQRALEALARTVTSSAEQISIAVGGLHEIAELAQKNLRQAEQLPHKLQDKIAEFQAQLAQSTDAEKEELERELLALRTTESERLEAVSQRIAKSSAEWSKLETATQQHLAAVTDALAKLQLGTANAIGKAQAAAEQAFSQARTEAARGLGEAAGQATRALEAAKNAALAEFESRIVQVAKSAAATIAAAELQGGSHSERTQIATAAAFPSPTGNVSADTAPLSPPPAVAPPAEAEPDDASTPISAPKRPRKTRREEPTEPAAEPAGPEATPATEVSEPATAENNAAPTPATSEPVAAEEPPPIPPQKFTEITAVAPLTAPPFPLNPPPPTNGTHQADAPAGAEDIVKPARKRAKKPEIESDPEPSLGLELDDPTSRAAAAGVLERVLTSDGATRLLVTAYIGIGNRLFIRGEGPGLRWDKGTPLQFVSIGKWRWETSDANAPVQFKLYKNDDTECAALGTQTLEPGHQQEVTAAF